MENQSTGRVFKFRVWNKDKKQWQTGIAMCSSDGKLITNHNEDFVLCQFTGLHDKNGKEIYEGDIVRIGSKAPIQVRWHDATAGFLGIGMELMSNTEVIGNIYEHGHLTGKYPDSFTSEADEATSEHID